MPRGKKAQEPTTKKRGKKVVEEEDVDDIIEEEEEQPSSKRSNKKQSVKSSKTSKRKKQESDEEDELSDLDVDEDDCANESADNDEIVTTHKHERQPIKLIDPKVPIGDLKIDEVLSYLIQLGNDTLNPQLKFGALNLKQQLIGRRRRPPQNFGGSKRNNFGPNPRFNRNNQYGGNNNQHSGSNNNQTGSNRSGPNRGMQQPPRTTQRQQSYPQEDLYNDE